MAFLLLSPEDESELDSAFLTRISTRESSTLTFSTVAASASLGVLALTLGKGGQAPPFWLALIGMVFAGLGVLYRELTTGAVDRLEHKMHSAKLRRRIEGGREGLRAQAAALTRRSAIRLFLLLPIVAWILSLTEERTYVCLAITGSIALSVGPSLRHLRPEG